MYQQNQHVYHVINIYINLALTPLFVLNCFKRFLALHPNGTDA